MELWRTLKYTLSLPERTLRSVSAAVGGVSRFLTDSLLPTSLRGTTFYQVFLGNTQRFLAESIGKGLEKPHGSLTLGGASSVASASCGEGS